MVSLLASSYMAAPLGSKLECERVGRTAWLLKSKSLESLCSIECLFEGFCLSKMFQSAVGEIAARVC